MADLGEEKNCTFSEFNMNYAIGSTRVREDD